MPAPLDAERTRLRTAGLTDDEISRIFVGRELGAKQASDAGASAGAPNLGVMSGVTNNMTVVLAHVRGFIPAIASQILTVRDRSASASARLAAFLSLVVKAAFIFALGYAIAQEWNQHVISATQIAASQATSETAVAENAARAKKAEADEATARAITASNEAAASSLALRFKEAETQQREAEAVRAKNEADASTLALKLKQAETERTAAEAIIRANEAKASVLALRQKQAETLKAEAEACKEALDAQQMAMPVLVTGNDLSSTPASEAGITLKLPEQCKTALLGETNAVAHK